jgi:hypothetical protein
MSWADGKVFLGTIGGTFSDFLVASGEGIFEGFEGVLGVVLPSRVYVVVLAVEVHVNIY